MQKLKLDKEQEKETLKEEHKGKLKAMEAQNAQILNDIEKLKAANAAIQKQILLEKHTDYKQKEDIMRKTAETFKDPSKFIESASYLDVNDLLWLYTQLGHMINKSIQEQHIMMPYQIPPMYGSMPSYQYPMIPMYNNSPLDDDIED